MTAETTKKRGLGRGLDALFQDARAEEESFQPKIRRADEIAYETKAMPGSGSNIPRRLPVDRLQPGRYQPRHHFDDDALDQLAESISVHGVLQPLLVRPTAEGMYEIIAGERRWRAAQRAQVHEVPVIIRDLNDQDTLEIALIENLQREDLTAVEEAEGYQRLLAEFGYSHEALGKRLGKSRSHIANTLRLLKLPQSVREMIQEGSLSAGHARALINAKNPEALARLVIAKGLSVRETETLAAKEGAVKARPQHKKAPVPKDVDILALEKLIGDKLGMTVTIDSRGQEGAITVAYKSLDQLDDLIARLGQAPKRA